MELINVKKKEENTFVGCNFIGPERGLPVYGGQTTAQALEAAKTNLPENHTLQSLYAHFHRPAFTSLEIKYIVENIRIGKSTINKRVTGYQKEKVILIVEIIFGIPQKSLEFQCKEKKLYAKEYEELGRWVKQYLQDEKGSLNFVAHELLEGWSFVLKFSKYFEICIARPKENFYRRELKIVLKENYEDVTSILVLLSDLFLMEAPLLIFKKNLTKGRLSLVTTSHHNIFFHEAPDCNERTFLYLIDCVRLCNGVALCEGYLFDSKKRHIFTAAQEVALKQED